MLTIQLRDACKGAGHRREPRVSVSRSVFARVDGRDRANSLGVDYSAHAIESILKYVAPELGWR